MRAQEFSPQDPVPLLSVNNLELYYGQFRALKGVDIAINSGEIISVIGANGAGKSSLIKAIAGIEQKISGKIVFRDRELKKLSVHRIVEYGIGLVPEGRKIFPSLSVEENILIGKQIGRKGPFTLEKIYAIFPDLAEKRQVSGTSLSGGQQQMIAIARALMTNPILLLCDEISLGLAPIMIHRLYDVLVKLAQEGLSILVVEQAVHKSLQISKRYYCMLEGRISLSGHSMGADKQAIERAYFGG